MKNFEPKIYGTIPLLSKRAVESYETLLERYPWFNAAHRLTQKRGDRLPANILLANYFRPPQDTFKVQSSKSKVQGSSEKVAVPPPVPHTEAERIAAEAIARREEQRSKRADADEADFPTTSGISVILSGDNNHSELASDDIIATFVSGGDYRMDFSQDISAPIPVYTESSFPTPDTDPTLKAVMEYLEIEDYHIDPDEIAPTPEKERLEAPLDLSADVFATEEMGGIYLKQSLLDDARKIYSKLSLHNPEKSGYFATLIADAETLADAKKAEKTRGLRK